MFETTSLIHGFLSAQGKGELLRHLDGLSEDNKTNVPQQDDLIYT